MEENEIFEPPWFFADLKVKKLHEDAVLPTRSNPSDAGLDLYSCEEIILEARLHGANRPGWRGYSNFDPSRAVVRTGISVEVPIGYGLFIWDRSGLSAKKGIHRVAGVCDSSYRGEIKVALVNLSNCVRVIKKGDRIAQAIIAPIALPRVVEVDELSDTTRGVGGFGSTGA